MTWNPYDELPTAPALTVTSVDIKDGEKLAMRHVSGIFGAGGEDVSPHVAWTDPPAGTQSYVVTMFDPDAPTGSGFWHWAVADIPASASELPSGAGEQGGAALPAPAFQLPNDARLARYIGAAPPAGSGKHRYIVAVHALDVPTVGVTAESTPAMLGFSMLGHILARGLVTAWYEA
jgi:Raf kinase inhibitor-like YbhB/YbcL family protein